MNDEMAAKIAEIEADCEARVEEAREEGLQEGRKQASANERLAAAEQSINDESWRFDDPTGQDADCMDHLFEELIQARDGVNEAYDPEGEAEARHLRACASYMP